MREYGVTVYVSEDGETVDIHKTVAASGSEEAAMWAQNLYENEYGKTVVGDIEVFPPGSDEAELFPV